MPDQVAPACASAVVCRPAASSGGAIPTTPPSTPRTSELVRAVSRSASEVQTTTRPCASRANAPTRT
ncbi:hypothetical protein [Pseudonocardia sp. T1-2H]|uniref:hypothetical protein n=1 Tax=Pseudonocardia sp. T1-2H TaxID=3128899 RepID=UPI0031019269